MRAEPLSFGTRATQGGAGLRIAYGAAALLWLGAAVWIFAHPAALGSDDALFFSRGLTHFSILEFSPQFPGYPGFILMGRALLPLAGTPVAALAWLTGGLALALPLLGGWVAARIAGAWAGVLASLALLAMPLLPDLALSLLSDGAGMVFVLLALALLPIAGAGRARSFLAGLALGWAAACRPSDGVLILAFGAAALAAGAGRWLIVGFALVMLPVLAGLLVTEPLYLTEGLRFTIGHALIWGHTPFSEAPRPDGWGQVLWARPGLGLLVMGPALVALAALPRLKGAGPVRAALIWAFLAHGIWILAFQNPDSLRHLAPLLILGPLILLSAGGRLALPLTGLCLMLSLAVLIRNTEPDPHALPPLARLTPSLRAVPPGSALATNEGVFLLRAEDLPLRIYDMHYPADAELGLRLASGKSWRLSSTPLPGRVGRSLPGRCLGEDSLILYPEN